MTIFVRFYWSVTREKKGDLTRNRDAVDDDLVGFGTADFREVRSTTVKIKISIKTLLGCLLWL